MKRKEQKKVIAFRCGQGQELMAKNVFRMCSDKHKQVLAQLKAMFKLINALIEEIPSEAYVFTRRWLE